MNFDRFRVPPKTAIRLQDYPTEVNEPKFDKAAATAKLADDVKSLETLQAQLAAQNTRALLVILQGIDAAGKDSTIRTVFSGVNPAGCRVTSFKVPSTEELDHDYLWRYVKALPERGMLGVFNRSYYEEVLVVRVHPQLLQTEHLHPTKKTDKIWAERFRHLNHFEQYLTENGTEVLKFFLHLSKEEQKKRFLERLDMPDKNWKFSANDVKERALWSDYEHAFEDMLCNTSNEYAPWHIVPADRKWFARSMVADTIVRKLQAMQPTYPTLSGDQLESLADARKLLEEEKD